MSTLHCMGAAGSAIPRPQVSRDFLELNAIEHFDVVVVDVEEGLVRGETLLFSTAGSTMAPPDMSMLR